ncbi:Ran-specific GTPase-activating protein, partial [Lachnellula suecica]
MDAFLGKITQHAMNYAIRSGIGITASFAIGQTSRLLKTIDNNGDHQELEDLQERLDSKIRIISPAIDMIELISARGNTTLESAVTLTKALRWDIQSLGVRLEKASAAEELSRKQRNKAKSRAAHELEIKHIVKDIRKLLTRIEDAVPLINLAITTSGASLSTSLPASVSPSRLLQASTFLTAGDSQYSMNPSVAMQVGPAFTLSLYMLFTGHAHRVHEDTESMRETTWKEVIHKARVKLMRGPLNYNSQSNPIPGEGEATTISGEGKATEYSYHIEIIEDLDDDRVHSFEDDEIQPGPYRDVLLAGIREILPIHQISKIFYADTGKILNIGSQGETNSPVLLLKRDINALPPRRMMEEDEKRPQWYENPEDLESPDEVETPEEEDNDSQDDIDQQLRRESSVFLPLQEEPLPSQPPEETATWRFPPDLDPEWLALEVYNEEPDTSSESEPDDSAYVSHRPSSSHVEVEVEPDETLASSLATLNLSPGTPALTPTPAPTSTFPAASPYGAIRTSLSLLEMLIRLTALQQFQQAPHLSIPDELLTFFLEESSTTGAGGDADNRRRTRRDARRKVGFDPYDESPVKRHGEEYQYRGEGTEYQYQGEGGGTPFTDFR